MKLVLALAIVGQMQISCRTTSNQTATLMGSSSRDERFVETVSSRYAIELSSIEAFTSRIDLSAYFEDINSKRRTNFVSFGIEKDTRCKVGLTTEQVQWLKAHPRAPLNVRTVSPGRTSDAYNSKIFLSFRNIELKTKEEFLVSCLQPHRRVSIADFVRATGGLFILRMISGDVPKYDVCCRCENDVFVVKGADKSKLLQRTSAKYFVMPNSTDNICAAKMNAKEYSVRPGDKYYDPSEERIVVWNSCMEADILECSPSNQGPNQNE